MLLTAPTAVNMPEGKYGSALANAIHSRPCLLLASSICLSELLFSISFSAVLRKKKRMRKKLITTPVVSASQEIVMPSGSPKIKPLAVDRKIDGKTLPALISTSRTKLMTIAHGPKERRYSTSPLTLPLIASLKVLLKKSSAKQWIHKNSATSSTAATTLAKTSGLFSQFLLHFKLLPSLRIKNHVEASAKLQLHQTADFLPSLRRAQLLQRQLAHLSNSLNISHYISNS